MSYEEWLIISSEKLDSSLDCFVHGPENYKNHIISAHDPFWSLTPGKNFRCTKCFRAFSVYNSLYRHSRYECGKEPRFGCCYCPYVTKHTTSVYQHVRRMHVGRELVYLDVVAGKVVKRRNVKSDLKSSKWDFESELFYSTKSSIYVEIK